VEVRRITSQGPQTVEDFYRELLTLSQRRADKCLPQCMLDLLHALAKDDPELVVWGMTSHTQLALSATDQTSRPAVSISPTSAGGWYINCVLPLELRPWPEAEVTGYTEQLSEAVRRVHLGLWCAGLLWRQPAVEPLS
jgi:hypothetical protein